MSDLARSYGELRRTGCATSGRHAVDEEAALTPIFHALSHGGVRGRAEQSRGGDAVAEFRRDPLTAPIPVQALAAAASAPRRQVGEGPRRRRSGAHALVEPREGGRHALLAV